MYFFYPLRPYLIPITNRIETEIEHYYTCINSLAKFCNDFYYSFQGVRYVGN